MTLTPPKRCSSWWIRLLTESFFKFYGASCSQYLSGRSRGSEYLDERVRLNTNGECADVGQPAFELDTIGHSGETKDAGARGEEMTSIIVCVKTYKIAVQDTE